jgi:hypothetical protein
MVLPTLRLILASLRQETLLFKCDLKSGYQQVKKGRGGPELAFKFKEAIYVFEAGPFGMKDLPAFFQEITLALGEDAISDFERGQGRISPLVFVYLDDFIFVDTHGTQALIGPSADLPTHMLARRGAVLGMAKCSAGWTRREEILGQMVDLDKNEVSLPQRKELELREMLRNIPKMPRVTPRLLAKLVGKLIAAEESMKFVALLSRALQEQVAEWVYGTGEGEEYDFSGKRDEKGRFEHFLEDEESLLWDTLFESPQDANWRKACEFIEDNWERIHGRAIFDNRVAAQLTSDASPTGIGGWWKSGRSKRPREETGEEEEGKATGLHLEPLPEELRSSISRKVSTMRREAWGLLQTARRALGTIRGEPVILFVDHKGLAYRALKGSRDPVSTKYLIELARLFLENEVDVKDIVWIPTETNTVADALSRMEEPVCEKKRRIVPVGWIVEHIEEVITVEAFYHPDFGPPIGRPCRCKKGQNFFGECLRKEDIIWCEPPVSLTSRALAHFLRSEARTMYLSTPSFPWSSQQQWRPFLGRLEKRGEYEHKEGRIYLVFRLTK